MARPVRASLTITCLGDMFLPEVGVHGPKEVHAIFVDAPIRG